MEGLEQSEDTEHRREQKREERKESIRQRLCRPPKQKCWRKLKTRGLDLSRHQEPAAAQDREQGRRVCISMETCEDERNQGEQGDEREEGEA